MTKYKKDNTILEIVRDTDCCESPREWDNFGTMNFFLGPRSNYSLGDKHDYETIHEFLLSLLSEEFKEKYERRAESELEYTYELIEDARENILPKDVLNKALIIFESKYIALSISVYEYSGITINKRNFDMYQNNRGIIFVSKDKVRKEYSVKRISKELEQKVLKILESEIKTYDQYLLGDVWGFRKYQLVKCDKCGSCVEEDLDSCWGFYGDDHKASGLLESARIEDLSQWEVLNERILS